MRQRTDNSFTRGATPAVSAATGKPVRRAPGGKRRRPGEPYRSPEYAGPYVPKRERSFPRNDGKAMASLVFGILTLVVGCCCPLAALFTGAAGITLGVLSWNAANRALAVAGVICASIGLVIGLLNAILGAYLAVTGQHPLFQ